MWAAAPRWALDSVRGPRLPPRGTGQPISLGTNAATLSAVSTPAFAGDREGAVTLGGSAGDTGAGGGGVGALMGYFADPVPDGEDGRLLLLSADFASDFAAELSEGLDVFGVIAAAVLSEGFGVLLLSDGFAEVSELDDAELDVPNGEDGRLLLLPSFADAADCGSSGVAPATGVPAPDAASGAVPAPVGAAVGWFVDVATPPAAGATESAPVDAEGPACSVPGPVA